MFDLSGMTALVTGASGGIGSAIAKSLAAQGATVALSGTRMHVLMEMIPDMAGDGHIVMPCDLSKPEEVDALVPDTVAKLGKLDILVNNAGITRDNILMRMKPEEWQAVIDTNLSAVYRASKACLRGMTKARWGRIVNITSVVGAMGNAGQSNYAASKAGVEGFSRALARELGSRAITVNCVAPGFIDTDMTRALNEDQREAMLGQIPLARLGEASEIAALVGFLCGSHAGYITGETIHINGGMNMA